GGGGGSLPKLVVVVPRRLSFLGVPARVSRPPPVSFPPQKAPPISAPDGPILTLTIPQSDPAADRKCSTSRTSLEKIDEARPWGTPLCSSITWSKSVYGIT